MIEGERRCLERGRKRRTPGLAGYSSSSSGVAMMTQRRLQRRSRISSCSRRKGKKQNVQLRIPHPPLAHQILQLRNAQLAILAREPFHDLFPCAGSKRHAVGNARESGERVGGRVERWGNLDEEEVFEGEEGVEVEAGGSSAANRAMSVGRREMGNVKKRTCRGPPPASAEAPSPVRQRLVRTRHREGGTEGGSRGSSRGRRAVIRERWPTAR